MRAEVPDTGQAEGPAGRGAVPGTGFRLRPAEAADAEAILDIWVEGWWDGHGDVAPAALRRCRGRDGLRARLDEAMAAMSVAEHDGVVAGFVSVKGNELANLYVRRSRRGGELAAALLACGEAMLAQAGVAEAFLWCAVGNDRAYRFYRRERWIDQGVVECDVATPEGPARLPSHRFVKRLRAAPGLAPPDAPRANRA